MESTEPTTPRERAEVEREFAQLLVQMTTLSFGRVQSFSPVTAQGAEKPSPMMLGPNMDSWPLHLKWQAIWGKTSEEGKPGVLAAAREEFEAHTRRVAPRVSVVRSEDDLIIEDGEGHPPESVAAKFRRTAGYVRRLRKQRARCPEAGTPLGSGEGEAESVDSMIARGLPARTISMMTGRPAATIQRAINRHRAAST